MLPKKPTDPKQVAGQDKLSFSHVPLSAVIALSKGMKPGVPKYGLRNWYDSDELSMSTYINGAFRHLFLHEAGETYVRDVDGLVSHIEAAISGLSVLYEGIVLGKVVDDRKKMDPQALNLFAAEICGETYSRLPTKEGEDK